uniref:Ferric reduction oxidase 8, mitochondrial n=1 Tax=Anthurium amnicola TaxID=1678845 RepID=A0A1D1ZD15_9ARAE
MAASSLLPATRLLVLAAFAVWVSIWVLKPTSLWKRSWHTAEDWASRTILRDVGLNVLVFCFPVLMAAALAYVYLHLLSRERRTSRRRPIWMITMSNPVIERSPIGTLSGFELLAASLFTVLLAWTFYSSISSDFRKAIPAKFLHLNRWQIKVMSMGIRMGSLAEICLAFLLLPVLRRMAVFKILGIQFEAAVRYHVWIGNVMILLAALHGIIIMSTWTAKHRLLSEITKWQRTGRVNLAGLITLATGLVIWMTSLPPIRRKQFHLFYSVHHLYIVFILFFLLHGGDRHFYLVLSGVILLALDKVMRVVQSRPTPCLVSAKILQCRAIELTLSIKGMKYTPTSLVFINVPSISKFQWHPFSITSSSNMDNDEVSFIVKCQGQWTSALYNKIKSMQNSDVTSIKCFPIAVEGPYGPTTTPYQRYDCLLLIAGGSGITPFLSILQDISSRRGNMLKQPTIIRLVYVVKKSEDLSMLNSVSPLLLNKTKNPGQLKLKVFVTQEKRSGVSLREILQEASQVQTIFFGTKCPLASAPRPEGFLSMAAITGLFSIAFLVSLVCLSHGFLPSGKKATQGKTPSWVRDLLVLSSFVIATGCSIFATILARWRKPENVSSVTQKHVTDPDLEMQSEDTRALQEEHEIHFGRRPNLLEILEDLYDQTGESKVGVFVCGPDSMQESVASFCKKHQKFNEKRTKHTPAFHSIKFSL